MCIRDSPRAPVFPSTYGAPSQWSGQRDENLLSAIAEEVSLRTDEFKGKELGNIVWAFAVLDFRDQVTGGRTRRGGFGREKVAFLCLRT